MENVSFVLDGHPSCSIAVSWRPPTPRYLVPCTRWSREWCARAAPVARFSLSDQHHVCVPRSSSRMGGGCVCSKLWSLPSPRKADTRPASRSAREVHQDALHRRSSFAPACLLRHSKPHGTVRSTQRDNVLLRGEAWLCAGCRSADDVDESPPPHSSSKAAAQTTTSAQRRPRPRCPRPDRL